MCACMRACVYVHMHTCVYVHVHTCVRVCVHAHRCVSENFLSSLLIYTLNTCYLSMALVMKCFIDSCQSTDLAGKADKKVHFS